MDQEMEADEFFPDKLMSEADIVPEGSDAQPAMDDLGTNEGGGGDSIVNGDEEEGEGAEEMETEDEPVSMQGEDMEMAEGDILEPANDLEELVKESGAEESGNVDETSGNDASEPVVSLTNDGREQEVGDKGEDTVDSQNDFDNNLDLETDKPYVDDADSNIGNDNLKSDVGVEYAEKVNENELTLSETEEISNVNESEEPSRNDDDMLDLEEPLVETEETKEINEINYETINEEENIDKQDKTESSNDQEGYTEDISHNQSPNENTDNVTEEGVSNKHEDNDFGDSVEHNVDESNGEGSIEASASNFGEENTEKEDEDLDEDELLGTGETDTDHQGEKEKLAEIEDDLDSVIKDKDENSSDLDQEVENSRTIEVENSRTIEVEAGTTDFDNADFELAQTEAEDKENIEEVKILEEQGPSFEQTEKQEDSSEIIQDTDGQNAVIKGDISEGFEGIDVGESNVTEKEEESDIVEGVDAKGELDINEDAEEAGNICETTEEDDKDVLLGPVDDTVLEKVKEFDLAECIDTKGDMDITEEAGDPNEAVEQDNKDELNAFAITEAVEEGKDVFEDTDVKEVEIIKETEKAGDINEVSEGNKDRLEVLADTEAVEKGDQSDTVELDKDVLEVPADSEAIEKGDRTDTVELIEAKAEMEVTDEIEENGDVNETEGDNDGLEASADTKEEAMDVESNVVGSKEDDLESMEVAEVKEDAVANKVEDTVITQDETAGQIDQINEVSKETIMDLPNKSEDQSASEQDATERVAVLRSSPPAEQNSTPSEKSSTEVSESVSQTKSEALSSDDSNSQPDTVTPSEATPSEDTSKQLEAVSPSEATPSGDNSSQSEIVSQPEVTPSGDNSNQSEESSNRKSPGFDSVKIKKERMDSTESDKANENENSTTGGSNLKIVGVTSAVGVEDKGDHLEQTSESISAKGDNAAEKNTSKDGAINEQVKVKQEALAAATATEKEDIKKLVNEELKKKIKQESKAKEAKEDEDDDVIAIKEEKKPVQKPKPSKIQTCIVCGKVGKCKYNIVRNGDVKHLCDDSCFKRFRSSPTTYLKQAESIAQAQSKPDNQTNSKPAPTPMKNSAPVKAVPNQQASFQQQSQVYKTCTVCQLMNVRTSKPFLNWQGLDFCGEECLGKYQGGLSNNCSYCSGAIFPNNKAKFCCRVGNEVKHFCSTNCNNDYVKRMKLCAFCNKDLAQSTDSFMAPVGETFKDFCSQDCLQKFEEKNNKDVEIVGVQKGQKATKVPKGNFICAVCGKVGPVKHEFKLDSKVNRLCSDPCFSAFQYANKLTLNTCDNCGTNLNSENQAPQYVQFEGQQRRFCSFMCVNTFRNTNKKTVPCAWCGNKKSNFDMIERVDANNKYQLFCSLNCLSLYRVNLQATSNQAVTCDQCRKFVPAQYHLTMSDASVRNFCSYGCVMQFQAQFQAPAKQVPPQNAVNNTASVGKGVAPAQPQQQTTTRSGRVVTKAPKVAAAVQQQPAGRGRGMKKDADSFPIISNVVSLAPQGTQQQINIKSSTPVTVTNQQQGIKATTTTTGNQTVQQQIIIQPPPPISVKNKSMLCKPFTQTKATSCRPHTQIKEVQTEGKAEPEKYLIPVPVPVYCPTPLAMYSLPTPILIPVPIPVPVPVFIPTTKKSANSILKQIKEIREKIPADPLEAELLMMAEAVAGKDEESSSSSEEEDNTAPAVKETSTAPATSSGGGGDLGEDMLQMALRMASEMTDEPVMDLENSLEPVAVNTALLKKKPKSLAAFKEDVQWATGEQRFISDSGEKNPHHYATDSECPHDPIDQDEDPQDMHDHVDDSGDQQSLMSDNNSPHNPVNHHEDVEYMYDNEAANTDYKHDNLADTGSPHDPIDQHEEQVYTGDNVLDSDRQLEPADQHKSPQDMHDHLDDSGDQQSLMSDNNSPHNPVNHHEDVDYMYDNEAANTDYIHDNLADTGSPHDPIDQHEEQVYTGDNVLDSDRQLEPADQHKSPQDMHDHLDDSGALSKSTVTWPYYKQLCKYAQTRLMSYNNRQSVEVENVTVKNYMNKLQMDDIDEGLIGEITPLERYLMETHDLIQVRGKKSSVVPMLIPPECTSVINFLADREVRSRVGINPKNDYLFPNKEPPPQPKPVIPPPPPVEEEDEYIPSSARSRRSRGGNKRQSRSTPRRNPKRQKVEIPQQYHEATPSPPAPAAPPPDANFHLKYTYGVNAFKHWVIQKNSQIEQASKPGHGKNLKTFKTDILQCTADELNYSLCLFVKEVRKPNGEEYAVDSIYYLCLGIQQYLFENGRIDNIFTDFYYERFTEGLNEILTRYEPKLNHAGQLVCRIEEEHLWESKQLGAHSPHVLLNSLVYFNTKYFMLKTSEDHLKLSFTHIMKHWKKTATGRGSGTGPNAGRSVYLRYYCPTPQGKDNQKKKKEEMPVYEQTENLDNPLRCPVKLYEFYLSKCPESIKNRNDTFYLKPERSSVPDSPVWYSNQSINIDHLTKLLNRIRLVREIQEAHLHTQPIYI